MVGHKDRKYFYPKGPKHPYEMKECNGCKEVKLIDKRSLYCNKKCFGMAHRGTDNHFWNPEASYNALHIRIRKQKGSAWWCTVCYLDCPGRSYEWASLTGNHADMDDYAQMCKPCHYAYDRQLSIMGVANGYTP